MLSLYPASRFGSDVRLKNSLLRTKYPEEPVAWIGDLPEGIGPVITFDELIHADTPSASDLARSLGFSPAQDEDHLSIINNMMKYLGVSCRRSTFLFSEVREMTVNVLRSPTRAYRRAGEYSLCRSRRTIDDASRGPPLRFFRLPYHVRLLERRFVGPHENPLVHSFQIIPACIIPNQYMIRCAQNNVRVVPLLPVLSIPPQCCYANGKSICHLELWK